LTFPVRSPTNHERITSGCCLQLNVPSSALAKKSVLSAVEASSEVSSSYVVTRTSLIETLLFLLVAVRRMSLIWLVTSSSSELDYPYSYYDGRLFKGNVGYRVAIKESISRRLSAPHRFVVTLSTQMLRFLAEGRGYDVITSNRLGALFAINFSTRV
jgi:hypothetical protein